MAAPYMGATHGVRTYFWNGIPSKGQHSAAFFVRLRRRHDGHGHTAHLVNLVVLDLGNRELFTQTKAVVAMAVERIR